MSSNSTESSEEFTVTLDEVILIHRSILNLSGEERARLILSPRIADVKIIDDNGKVNDYYYKPYIYRLLLN